MSNKNLKTIGVASLVAILALGAFMYLNREDDSDSILGVYEPIPSRPETPPDAKPTDESSSGTNPEKTSSGTNSQLPETPVVTARDFTAEKIQAQKKITQEYKNLSKLEVNLPAYFTYTPLEVQDDMAMLYGGSTDGQRGLAIVAARRTASPDTIVGFLNENKESFPMLKEQGFIKSGEIRTLTAPKETGMGKVTLIPGQSRNGKSIWVAHVERKDNAGSYLFVLEDYKRNFDQNEENFDSMLQSLRAK